MPDTYAPTDAFAESGKYEYIESQNKERGEEGKLPISFSFVSKIINAVLIRHGFIPESTPFAAREDDDAVFLRRVYSYENTVDPGTSAPSSMTVTQVLNRYDGTEDSSTTTGSANTSTSGMSMSSSTVLSDSNTDAVYQEIWTDGTNTLTYTITYDTPNTQTMVRDKLQDIIDAKLPLFSTASSNEQWTYDNDGSIISETWESGGFGHFATTYFHPDLWLSYRLSILKLKVTTSPTSIQPYSIGVDRSDLGTDPYNATPTTSYFKQESIAGVDETFDGLGTDSFWVDSIRLISSGPPAVYDIYPGISQSP